MILPKKSLGQNFLIDPNITEKILKITNIENKNIIEIGPGRGALTEAILKKKPKSLLMIEKDKILANQLKIKLKNFNNVKVINKDILDIKIEKIIKSKSVILGNLPYNISSKILINFIKFEKWPPKFSEIIFMFQKEVAEKIIGKSYGRLSIITNYKLNCEKKFEVSPNCFYPRPKVISSVIHFTPKKNVFFKIKNLENLEKLTNIFFSKKRKMIKKNLHKVLSIDQIKKLKDLNLSLRPADLKPETYYKIVELIESK